MIASRTALAVMIGAVLALSALGSAAAGQYPIRPVTLVLPLPPGGTAYPLCRLLAEKLGIMLGHPFIVESLGGAGGNIGAEAVARAAPDGHMLLCAPEFSFLNQLVYPKLAFDPLAFEPVGVFATFPSVLTGRTGLPFATLVDLIAYARGNPGKLNYASQGKGSLAHLTFEALKMRAGIDIVHVPYRGGGPALNDLLAGHVDLYAGPLVGSFAHIQAEKVRLLAITSGSRVAVFPQVPTLSEHFPGLEVDSWMSVAAPPNTPKQITQKLSVAITEVIHRADVRARILDLQAEPSASAPEQMAERIRLNVERWKPVVKAANITID
jgi:tripartite-type tricarboxylate transporter receptor subunit TctC